eukprot:scaffold11014_cov94-Phaeocystis_antarctica.AAC.1
MNIAGFGNLVACYAHRSIEAGCATIGLAPVLCGPGPSCAALCKLHSTKDDLLTPQWAREMAVTSPFSFLHWGREGQKALAHVATLGSAGGCGQDGGRGDGGDGGEGCGSGGPWKSTVEAVVTVPRWASDVLHVDRE